MLYRLSQYQIIIVVYKYPQISTYTFYVILSWAFFIDQSLCQVINNLCYLFLTYSSESSPVPTIYQRHNNYKPSQINFNLFIERPERIWQASFSGNDCRAISSQ